MAFSRSDAPIFFGRSAETRALLRRLSSEQGERFLLVTGASGSGKSSLVRAGVWPALEEGRASRLPNSGDWLITDMVPGKDPFLALANSLGRDRERRFDLWRLEQEADKLRDGAAAFPDLLRRVHEKLPPHGEWLLILDQMEELFTPACEQHREPFLDLLLEASEQPRFRIIATIRSDFLDQCVAHPGLSEIQNNGGHYGLPAPGPQALSRMITGPVQELDLATPMELDPELEARLVTEALNEPGGLALLAFALKDLYSFCAEQRRTTMDLAAYRHEKVGGLKGVLKRRADAALEQAGDEGRAALPRVFSRLVTVQADDTATRRRELLEAWTNDPAALCLIDAFTDRDTRLLVIARENSDSDRGATLEVAHEALLREWDVLRDWIGDCQAALRLRDLIQEECRVWVEQGHPDYRHWGHERLQPARDLLYEANLLGDLEQDPELADFLVPEAELMLAELLCSGTDHDRRERIGMRLSEISEGCSRPGVGVIDGVPDILWCAIPGGSVEIEEHGTFKVAPFYLAAYPVTYAQYRAFLDDKEGYHSGAWWKDLKHEEEPGAQLRRYASYPADYVSWYDATAFCRWLSQRLGHEVRLPDEWERQWAAQSAQAGFDYPWGEDWREEVANTKKEGIGRTTDVGVYPGGRNEQGVYDLIGNVREWCRNKHGNPRGLKGRAGDMRAVRGGSWSYPLDFAHAGTRDQSAPYLRDHLGFRVLCVPPPF